MRVEQHNITKTCNSTAVEIAVVVVVVVAVVVVVVVVVAGSVDAGARRGARGGARERYDERRRPGQLCLEAAVRAQRDDLQRGGAAHSPGAALLEQHVFA